jgi:hypothetical protein
MWDNMTSKNHKLYTKYKNGAMFKMTMNFVRQNITQKKLTQKNCKDKWKPIKHKEKICINPPKKTQLDNEE